MSVRNIGSFIPMSDQIIADEAQAQEIVRRLLVRGVRKELERQVFAGAGTGQLLTGFSVVSGKQSDYDGTSDSSPAIAFDAGAGEYEDTAEREPAVAIMSATTWAAYSSSATTTGALVGPRQLAFDGVTRRTAWGTPVVVSSLIPNGDIWLIDPSDVVLYDRKQAGVEMGYINDDFQKMQQSLRAYVRAALVCWEPMSIKRIQVNV